MWCEVLLSKLQRLLCLPLPYELNQSLLLQVEGELVVLLKDLHDGRVLDQPHIHKVEANVPSSSHMHRDEEECMV